MKTCVVQYYVNRFLQVPLTLAAAPPVIPNTSINQEVVPGVATGHLRGAVTVPRPVPAVGAGAGRVSTVVPGVAVGAGGRGECPPWTEQTRRRDTGASRGARDAGGPLADLQDQGNPTN